MEVEIKGYKLRERRNNEKKFKFKSSTKKIKSGWKVNNKSKLTPQEKEIIFNMNYKDSK